MAQTTAKKVAQYIIQFSNEHGDLVTNLKLQKLVYYAQAWYLALNDEPLFDDRLEAWVRGPVQPNLYQDYKNFGWNPISADLGPVAISPHIKSHLDEVMSVYGEMTGFHLERLTHQEDPWLKARGSWPKDVPSNSVISHEDMKDFYKVMANEEENQV